jgi:hypothetical protein
LLEIAVLDCCGPDDSAASRKYVAFLERKFPGRVRVSFYDPEQPAGPEAVPPELFKRLAEQGVRAVPVLAVGGTVISQGSLPDWIESLELIERHLQDSSAPAPAQSGDQS